MRCCCGEHRRRRSGGRKPAPGHHGRGAEIAAAGRDARRAGLDAEVRRQGGEPGGGRRAGRRGGVDAGRGRRRRVRGRAQGASASRRGRLRARAHRGRRGIRDERCDHRAGRRLRGGDRLGGQSLHFSGLDRGRGGDGGGRRGPAPERDPRGGEPRRREFAPAPRDGGSASMPRRSGPCRRRCSRRSISSSSMPSRRNSFAASPCAISRRRRGPPKRWRDRDASRSSPRVRQDWRRPARGRRRRAFRPSRSLSSRPMAREMHSSARWPRGWRRDTTWPRRWGTRCRRRAVTSPGAETAAPAKAFAPGERPD